LLREQLEGCRRRKGNMTSHVQSMISWYNALCNQICYVAIWHIHSSVAHLMCEPAFITNLSEEHIEQNDSHQGADIEYHTEHQHQYIPPLVLILLSPTNPGGGRGEGEDTKAGGRKTNSRTCQFSAQLWAKSTRKIIWNTMNRMEPTSPIPITTKRKKYHHKGQLFQILPAHICITTGFQSLFVHYPTYLWRR
jgi:hypothetical protein